MFVENARAFKKWMGLSENDLKDAALPPKRASNSPQGESLRRRKGDRSVQSLQLVIVTGVPVEIDLKKFSAMNSGMRMQPCEAG